MATTFEHQPHPHIEARRRAGPPKVRQQAGNDLNSKLALALTAAVGTMWCAYVFTVIALVGLPSAINQAHDQGPLPLVQWVAQTFIQLVMLSVIMVGQNIISSASDRRSEMTFKDAEATFHEAEQIQLHLQAQDEALTQMLERLERLEAALQKG
jgi:hypothetical protein